MLPSFVSKPRQTWLLWHKCKALGQRPSELLNITDDYVAYCLDEAVIYFGLMVESELEQAGHKPSKEERKARRAREDILDRILGDEKDQEAAKAKRYADPALMFR